MQVLSCTERGCIPAGGADPQLGGSPGLITASSGSSGQGNIRLAPAGAPAATVPGLCGCGHGNPCNDDNKIRQL